MEEFFKRMDRDYDGRLSFGEFMGEETPLEKVILLTLSNWLHFLVFVRKAVRD